HSYLEGYSGLEIEMKWIPKGHFEMGSKLTADEVASKLGGKKEWYGGEFPVHKVGMDGFWMGKTEVTVGQFRRFVDRTGYKTDAEIGGGAWNLVGGQPGQ